MEREEPKVMRRSSSSDRLSPPPSPRSSGEFVDNRAVVEVQQTAQDKATKSTAKKMSRFALLTSGSSLLHSKKVPPGVQFLRTLGDGWAVGYDATEKKVYLYNDLKKVAHVQIDVQSSMTVKGKKDLLLHTHTDDREAGEGGQGYMTLLAPIALKFIADKFSTGEYVNINMAPAQGAATKGMIDQLTKFRSKLAPKAGYMNDANKFTVIAEQLRLERKKRGGEQPGANDWNEELMFESAHQLQALQVMENAESTGIKITGVNAGINIIGSAIHGLEEGDAFTWYDRVSKAKQSLLQVTIPISVLKRMM